ncbi:MAG: glycoside hydrolase family protein [Sphingomonas sp.]|jgi:lysozyme|uniref:glycoside hydrolase family protein n=1 Tax=Sphingomonas sp. TaxID=28214 RepID=UPI0035650CFD
MTYGFADLCREIARDEGDRLRVYRCTEGKLSVGKGRNLDDVGISQEETRALGITVASIIKNGITQAQSDALFANDIARSEADLDRRLPWWRTLDPVRQRVLLNMCFNMGIGDGVSGLTGFRNTLELVRTGRYEAAAAAMAQSKWHRQVGARALRLEAMMKTGRVAK